MSEPLVVKTSDGAFSCYVARPSQSGRSPVVVILQEIFGVNDGIRSIADAYALRGYIAVAPDLFWRAEANVSLTDADKENWEKGFSLYASYDLDKGIDDISKVIAASRTLNGANGKVGVTGYCLGGLLTYLSATRTDADAFAAYYGGATENWLAEAPTITAPLIYHLAEEDEYIDKPAQAAIRKALGSNAMARVYNYPGRKHAFARPDGLHFDGPDAMLAEGRTEEFFSLHFG